MSVRVFDISESGRFVYVIYDKQESARYRNGVRVGPYLLILVVGLMHLEAPGWLESTCDRGTQRRGLPVGLLRRPCPSELAELVLRASPSRATGLAPKGGLGGWGRYGLFAVGEEGKEAGGAGKAGGEGGRRRGLAVCEEALDVPPRRERPRPALGAIPATSPLPPTSALPSAPGASAPSSSGPSPSPSTCRMVCVARKATGRPGKGGGCSARMRSLTAWSGREEREKVEGIKDRKQRRGVQCNVRVRQRQEQIRTRIKHTRTHRTHLPPRR